MSVKEKAVKPFDLQFFAEGMEPAATEPIAPAGIPAGEPAGVPAAEPVGEPAAGQTTEPTGEQPTLEDILSSALTEPAAQGEQQTTEPASQQTIEPGQQSTNTQTEQQPDAMQQILEMQKQQQQMMGMLAQAMQQNQQANAAQTEPEIEQPEMFIPQVPDTLPEDLQQEVDGLYLEDPAKALAKVSKWQQEQVFKAQQEHAIQQQQEQQRRQQQTQQQFVQGFTALIQQNGREIVDKVGPRIEQIMMKEHPELLNFPQAGVQVAFQLARAEQAQAEAPAKFLQQSDARQKIKDAVREEVINEYLQGVQNGNQAPATISEQPGAAPAVTPPNKFRTMEEAASAMLKAYGG